MGGDSQIDTELRLLKAAIKNGHYIYYHLLSGEDLPIKTQDFIHVFLKEHSGKEFVCFQEPKFKFEERIRYYYFFQEKEGRKRNLYSVFRKTSIAIQKLIGIKRNKNIQFQKGANWFSITDDLARYVCSRSSWIFETFKNTIFCDEIFLQTIVHNSRFKKNLYHQNYDNDHAACVRLIDWKRGAPYVFTSNDYLESVSYTHLTLPTNSRV